MMTYHYGELPLPDMRALVNTWNKMAATTAQDAPIKTKNIPRGKPKSGRVWKSEKERLVLLERRYPFKVKINFWKLKITVTCSFVNITTFKTT